MQMDICLLRRLCKTPDTAPCHDTSSIQRNDITQGGHAPHAVFIHRACIHAPFDRIAQITHNLFMLVSAHKRAFLPVPLAMMTVHARTGVLLGRGGFRMNPDFGINSVCIIQIHLNIEDGVSFLDG